jgi:hypothetical protein
MEATMENMTTSELMSLNAELGLQIDTIKQKRLQIKKIIDSRTEDSRIQAKLAGMSDSEKAKLVQVIQAEGIQSKEVVGTPGA